MDIEKALLIKSGITNNHSLPQSQKLTQATDIQEEEIRISINLPYVEGPVKNYGVYSDLIDFLH